MSRCEIIASSTTKERRETVKKLLIALATIFGIILVLPNAASATREERPPVTFCHAAGQDDTLTFVTLTLPYVAVFGPAGHFNEGGSTQAGHEADYLGACRPVDTTTTTSSTTTTSTTTTSTTTTTTEKPCEEDCQETTTTTSIYYGCIIGCDTVVTTTTEPVDETTTTTTEVIDDGEETTTTPVPPTDPPTTPPTTGGDTSPRLPDTGRGGSGYAAGMGAILLGLGTGLLGITKLARR